MSKIIYIAGLGHSGSTLLDMSFGTLSGVIGLGELKTIMDDKTRNKHYSSMCSCGKQAKECEVWKEIPNLIKNKSGYAEKIEAILEFLKNLYGKDIAIVDSSKNSYPYIEYLKDNHDLQLIFLTRDIRSWSYSRHLSSGKTVLYFIFRWYFENLKLLTRIKDMGAKISTVGYEELSLYPEQVLRGLTAEAGLKYDDRMLQPGLTQSHIISGNIARVDSEKRKKWVYDARWFTSIRVLLNAPVYLLFYRINRKLVYSRVRQNSVNDFFLF
jgi:hypothetical protein